MRMRLSGCRKSRNMINLKKGGTHEKESMFVNICFIYLGIPMLNVYVYNCYTFLLLDLFIIL